MSTLSNTSSHHSNHNHGNPIRFDQPVGHQFASNILVANLAIRSTAYNNNTTSAPPPIIETDATIKARRRVTFNLDDIQIQTIPAYDSSSSISSSSEISLAEEEEEDDIITNTSIMMMSNKDQEEVIQEPPSPTPPISQPSTLERISKKACYDALQKRKQFRRDQQQPTTKPGYWYPLASPRTSNMIRQPLPAIRSLEMTEKLINESIQREMALNPNLHYTPSSPSPSSHSDINDEDDDDAEEEKEKSTPITIHNSDNSRLNTVSMLITDTDDEEEEEDEENIEYDEPPTTIATTTTATNTVSSSSDEEKSASTTTSLPPPTILNEYGQEKEETYFTKLVYNELAKRHNQQVLSTPEYQPPRLTFPFEQNLVPISANRDVLIISPPPSPPPLQMLNVDDDSDPIWIDHPSLLINNRLSQQQHERRGLFFVKVLKTESLDFPIENDSTNTFCSIKYKDMESRSRKQTMTHTMKIEHEMKIEDVDPDEQIAITIYVDENSTKKSNNWYNRIRSSSDFERYVHEKDGSICQTLFSPSRFVVDGSLDQTATLMLVNNWYRTNNELPSPSLSSLLLKRSSSIMMKKKNAVVLREKAVGKIYIQCLYITTSKKCDYLPQTMDEAIEALNAKRFHQTDWQSGYLYQLDGNTKCLKRRYFTLTGGSLFAYRSLEQQQQKRSLYKIPLSRAIKLVCYGYFVAERPLHLDDRTSPATLLNQLDSVIMVHQEEDQEEASIVDKNEQHEGLLNGFQLVFDNGEKIQFSCESLEERNKWIAVLEVMICKLPKLPDWIIS